MTQVADQLPAVAEPRQADALTTRDLHGLGWCTVSEIARRWNCAEADVLALIRRGELRAQPYMTSECERRERVAIEDVQRAEKRMGVRR